MEMINVYHCRYNAVSGDVHFVQESFELFEHVFAGVRARVANIDTEEFVKVILNRLTRHLTCYKEAQRLAGVHYNADGDRKLQNVIVAYETLHGHLAMSNLPDSETDHLRSLVVVVLKGLLPSDYRLTGSALYLVRELISRNVLLSLVEMLADPTWINGMVIHILKEEEEIAPPSEEPEDEIADIMEDDVIESKVEDAIPHPPAISLPVVESPDKNEVDPHNIKISFSAALDSDNLKLDIPFHRPDPNFFSQDIPGEENVVTDLSISPKSESSLDEVASLASTSELSASAEILKDENINTNSSVKDNNATGMGLFSAGPLPLSSSANLAHFNEPPEAGLTIPLSQNKKMTRQDEAKPSRSGIGGWRFFQHVRIPEAINVQESYEGGGKYTLYIVDYCAPPRPVKKKFVSPFTFKGNDRAIEPTNENQNSQLFHFQVRRRFREFLTLQDRLNDKAVIRKVIRNVRGPSRMFPMPIGNMDKNYIEKRRKFLQAYLRELCTFPTVCQSNELREFLAYSSDPRIAYVRRPSDYIPRVDKLLKNAVQELLGTATSKITSTFSGEGTGDYFHDFEQPPPPAMLSSKSMPTLNVPPLEGDGSSKSIPVPIQGPAFSNLKNPVKRFKNMMLGRPTDVTAFEECSREFGPFSGPRNANDVKFRRNWRSADDLMNNRTSYHLMQRRSDGDGCDTISLTEENIQEGYFIASQIFHLVRKIWDLQLGSNTLLFVSLARYLKEYVNTKVKFLTQKDKWLHYVKSLQDALWPNGDWGKGKSPAVHPSEEEVLKEAQSVLEETFPDALRVVVGNQRYKSGVSDLLETFQNPVINRHLSYHLLDILVQFIFPDLHTVVTRKNISL
ncbi:unnamed protein product [Clavelina lepadiformis]|uniref:Sorting nexin-19 n=1 Tax=Clavelina lepadiformis TaxID=159417 RepID=A0ABP0GQ57_CLALP